MQTSSNTRIDSDRASSDVAMEDDPSRRGWIAMLGAIVAPLARLRDMAAAAPGEEVKGDDRPYLDTIAFREVLPLLEEKHLLLSEIKDLSRRAPEDAEPERLAALQKQYDDGLAELLEQLERAARCIHSRRHHDIRDMLENVVLFDNFQNDFYLRNICNTMKDAMEAVARAYE